MLAYSRRCVPVSSRGEKADDKKSPFAKGGQRGNVNTGSFRMSSGAVHAALAISAGSKSGAGRRGSSVGGEAGSGVRGPVPGRGEEAGNKKSPFAKGGQRGNVNMGFFQMRNEPGCNGCGLGLLLPEVNLERDTGTHRSAGSRTGCPGSGTGPRRRGGR